VPTLPYLYDKPFLFAVLQDIFLVLAPFTSPGLCHVPVTAAVLQVLHAPMVQAPSDSPRPTQKSKPCHIFMPCLTKIPARTLDLHAIRPPIQACSERESQQNLTYLPRRTQGMRSSFGVRARVRFLTQLSGT
jgi:hypothetical protein